MASKRDRGQGDIPTGDAAGSNGGEQRSSGDVRTGIIQLKTAPKPVAVQYSVIDGMAIFEGDIVLGTVAEVQNTTEAIRGGLEAAVIRPGDQFHWPNCRVPFTIDPALPNQQRVTDAIAHWEQRTNYRFPARTANDPDFITFRPANGCSSMVGRQTGQQFINLAAGCSTGNVIHEIGHSIGLWHEQSREDRDQFVTINWNKVQQAAIHNFDQHITDGDDVGNYDYGSIMHYPRDAFSIDGSDTIVPTNPANAQIGQRTALSQGDINAANSLCSPPVQKLPISDPVITKKETIKDARLDTKKEVLADTRKEFIKDKIKDVSFDPIKRAALDPPFQKPGEIFRGNISGRLPGDATPFSVAAAHQAPGAGGGNQDSIMQLDQQLQQIADALHQAEVQRDMLQQQYDETYKLLNQLLDQSDRGS